MNTKTDEQLRQDVLDELKWETRVKDSEIAVSVKQGVVMLTGVVDSYAKSYAAQEAAHRVAGVLDVANDIQVKFSIVATPTDTEIARAVRHALEWDVLIPDEHIRTTVSDGWVTLEGDVDTISQREDAERAIRNLSGVRGLHNRIDVNPPRSAVNSSELQAIIEGALERRADRLADRIRVSVDDSDVTISGTVRSYAEKRAVIGAVSHAPGVRFVKDHLFIELPG